jgi:hypothetical protein
MKVRVSRKLRGELSIDAIGFPVKAGQVIELSPEQETDINVSTAILKGLIVDVNAVKEIKEVKEESMKKKVTKKMTLTELNKASQKDDLEEEDKIHQAKKAIEELQAEIDATATPTKMSAFDMEKQTMLNKDESTKAAMDRIGGIEIESLQVGTNIDFSDEGVEIEIDPLAKPEPKEESVDIFKTETKKTAKKTTKKARKTTKKTTKKASKKTAAAKKAQKKLKEAAKKISESSIKPVGNQREEKTTDMLAYDNSGEGDDIGFVDQEQEKALLAKRPELNQNKEDLF